MTDRIPGVDCARRAWARSRQFFINLKDNDFLDHKSKDPNGWGYAVFGRVVSGMDVVDQIAKTPTGSTAGHSDVPLQDVIIERFEIVK